MRNYVAFVLVTLNSYCISGTASAADTPRRLIAVSGEGQVEVPADHIALSLTVTTDGDELLDARAANDKRATAISKLVGEQGIKPEDLKTANFDIAAQFDKDQGSMRYRVLRTVVISVRDIPKFEPLLASLIKQGGFKINSISLEHSQLAKYQAEARIRAYADAKQKAFQLAELDGLRLGNAWRVVVDDVDLEKTPFVTSVVPVVGSEFNSNSKTAGASFQVAPEKPATVVAQTAPAQGDKTPVLAPGHIKASASVTIQFEAE